MVLGMVESVVFSFFFFEKVMKVLKVCNNEEFPSFWSLDKN